MDSGKTKTKYEELGLSQKIIISNEIYTFKKQLINDFISYRCIYRNCKASIKISLEVAKKINNKEENNNILEYTLIGIHANHPIKKDYEESLNNIKTEKEQKELAKNLIKNNLDLPLTFHVKNLDANKIKISHIKIKNMLHNLRKENFPKDEEFLDHIELIKIDLGETEELKNISFCPSKENFIILSSIKLERIVFFTSIFQLKLLSECEELYIDGTFKMAPKNYYQILNIWGYSETKKLYLPLMHILMTTKNQIAYKHIFNKITEFITDNNININLTKKIIITDYEKSLRNALNEVFKPKLLKGCFFYYPKLFGKKCRDFGLTKKFRKDSTLFLKYYKYFMKNWFNNKSYNFNRISYENYQRRTNNIYESFHRTLNNIINHNHPKIAYLVDKLKYFALEAYRKYTASLVRYKPPKNESNNIAKDIFDFIDNFHKKYGIKLEIFLV